MPSLTGALNGTDVLVQLEDTEGGATFSDIAGQVSGDNTLNTSLININNKAAGGVREFLEGEGLQEFDLSLNAIFNTDASFVRAQDVARGKLGVLARIVFGAAETWEGRVMIPSFADTSPNEDALTAAITLQSTGAFAWS